MQHAVALELKLENSPSVVAHEGQLWGQDIQKKSHFIFRTLRNRSLPSYDSARNNLALYGRASIHHDLLDT